MPNTNPQERKPPTTFFGNVNAPRETMIGGENVELPPDKTLSSLVDAFANVGSAELAEKAKEAISESPARYKCNPPR